VIDWQALARPPKEVPERMSTDARHLYNTQVSKGGFLVRENCLDWEDGKYFMGSGDDV
jgi:hypothetical protein